MKKVIMFGQFKPPVTGEAVVNEKVYNLLKSNNYLVSIINSAIINNANSVGKFSFSKIVKSILLYITFFKRIDKHTTLYLTPGQTKLGIYRVIPIILICKLFKVRIIAHWHGYGILWLIKNQTNLTTRVLAAIDSHILLTRDLMQKIKELGFSLNNVQIISNYIEESLPAHTKQNLKAPLSVIFVGSLMAEKGILVFIEVATALPKITFNICGTGSPTIVKQVEEVCTKHNNLIYHGLVSGSKKAALLGKADIFVLQTHYPTEGVPLSILEAMANGCAIVTTAHNGIPETVEGAALFVEKNSAQSLKETLINLDKDQTSLERYKVKALKQAEKFNLSSFENDILNVFKEVK